MESGKEYCDDCGGVGVVGDPANKPGAKALTIACGTCAGTGLVNAVEQVGIDIFIDLPEPTYAGSSDMPGLFDFEKMEEYAFAHVEADRTLRNIPMPSGWRSTFALPEAPEPRYFASPRMGVPALYSPEQMREFAQTTVKADRVACKRATIAAPKQAHKVTGVTFGGWYQQTIVGGSVERKMERAWDSGRRLLLDGLIGEALPDTRAQFEAYCRSIGKNDSDLQRAEDHSTLITGNDYTWSDVNSAWNAWKAATAALIVKQKGIDSI